MDETLQQIIARVPPWAGARSIQTSSLAGGISNLNYRVDVDGEPFVVRVCGKDLELLGVDRQHEYESSVIAAETGVAPQVLYFFPDLGSLITRFIHGSKIPPEQMGGRANIERVASAVRRLHRARPFPATFSAFRTIEEYHRTAQRLGAAVPADMGQIIAQAARVETAVYRDGLSQLVPCHNDLLNENFLDDGDIRIIDYEYAAMGDPFFDLANFSAHHRFSDEQEAWLLESYFGDGRGESETLPFATSWARLKLMRTISDLREAMWGVVQTKLSKLDFDYQAYAVEFFGRYREPWGDERVAGWLRLVTD